MAQLQNSLPTPREDGAAPPSGPAGLLHGFISFCLEGGIHLWVRLTGRLVRRSEAPWLAGPLRGRERIGTGIYERVAQAEGLLIRTPPHAGLLEHFNVLRGPNFNPDAVHPDIRHFYEHAAEYRLDVWSEVSLIGRFFLWLLVEFISRPASGRIVNTGWLRRLKSSGRVIYAGLYSATQLPDEAGPCVKVTFPCRGSANVYLNPVAHPDGSFGLVSSGSAFGRTGFYRMIDGGPEHYIVRHVRSLREVFHVYVDAEEVLRTDHTVFFLGLSIIRLHYKMTRVSAPHLSAQDEQDLITVDDIL
jgi:hypothetical protein